MSETNTITLAEFNGRLIEDNRELIRIIGNALYPAIEQLKLYKEARKEIRSMNLEKKNFIWAQSPRKGNRLGKRISK